MNFSHEARHLVGHTVRVIRIPEIFFEKYTDLIEYRSWTWWYSFFTIFFLSFFVRMIMLVVNKKVGNGKGK
ncbi:hypothetical protein [Anoxybacillus sp. J5B_2022]|uniref:hypothetical protein n=1 Tax=Anoxybacillus sp. J5B_2022 TaxID=3003246 RepID=UPI00228662A8|nr:hypothetical protein [Anoxybacillus sp. J5B_2022]MCZ0756736.1 hypothetical protein [Anoxybacillus sp. J5B_2022]